MNNSNNHQSLLERLDKLPPFVVYALARKHGRTPMDFNTLLKASNLTERTFSRIASRSTWKGVKIEQVDAFCSACRIDPFSAKKHLAFLSRSMARNRPLPHLPIRRLRTFAAQCQKWKESQAAKASASQ